MPWRELEFDAVLYFFKEIIVRQCVDSCCISKEGKECKNFEMEKDVRKDRKGSREVRFKGRPAQ